METIATIGKVLLIALAVLAGICLSEWAYKSRGGGFDTRSSDYRREEREQRRHRRKMDKQLKKENRHLN